MTKRETVTMHYDTHKYPCILKDCRHKQRNGRCELSEIVFGYVRNDVFSNGPIGTDYHDCHSRKNKEVIRP